MRATKYLFLVGIILFAFIVYFAGPLEILSALAKIDLLVFLFALAFFLPSVLLKGFKQNVLMGVFGARLPLGKAAKIWLIGFFLGLLTPGKGGDFFRGIYLSRNSSVSSGKCLTAVAVERALDLVFLFAAGILGFLVLSIAFGLEPSFVFLLLAIFLVFLLCIFIASKKALAAFVARPFFAAFVPERFKARMRSGFHGFYEGLAAYKANKSALFYALLLTAATWLVAIAQYYLVAVALGLNVSYLFLLAVMPIALLVEALPISFSGIGTRDATLIFLLSFKGILVGQAISFSLMLLALNVILAFFGMLFFQREKVSV